MMKLTTVMVATVLAMAGVDAQAAGVYTPLGLMASVAEVYAVKNLPALVKGEDVHDGGLTIPNGSAYGQSLHPSTDMFRAMAYLPSTGAGGDVSLSFSPVGCNRAKTGACVLVVRTVVEGEARTVNINAR